MTPAKDLLFRILPPKRSAATIAKSKAPWNAMSRAQSSAIAQARARQALPAPSSWWADFASDPSRRAEFVAEVVRRDTARVTLTGRSGSKPWMSA